MGKSFFRKNLATGTQKKEARLIDGLLAKLGERGVQLIEKKAAASAANLKGYRGSALTGVGEGSVAQAEQPSASDPTVGQTLPENKDPEQTVVESVSSSTGVQAVVIFSDAVVCEFLALERYKLVAARTAKNRGHDWEIVGEQAGMTRMWLIREAMLRGMSKDVAAFNVDNLPRVNPEDGVVTCRLIGVWPNLERVTVEVLASGKREVCEVPRIDRPPTMKDTTAMSIGWQFDALRIEGELKWISRLNNFSYYRSRV